MCPHNNGHNDSIKGPLAAYFLLHFAVVALKRVLLLLDIISDKGGNRAETKNQQQILGALWNLLGCVFGSVLVLVRLKC